MVERLKQAIEKARQQRSNVAAADADTKPIASMPPVSDGRKQLWENLPELAIDYAAMARERLVFAEKSNAEQVPFDILRTRLMTVCRSNKWRRVGITSPTKGCGKTFVAVNLAFSLSRNHELKTILIDLDLKNPQLGHILGATTANPSRALIEGSSTAADVLQRCAPNLAVAIANQPSRKTAEVMQGGAATAAIADLLRDYQPDMILFDLPPMFVSDDVLGFMHNLDALIVVAAAGQTTAAEITECESLIGNGTHFLGVVLNKVESSDIERYETNYGDQVVSA
jgi:Mrp family chromosome partitioning ATPase